MKGHQIFGGITIAMAGLGICVVQSADSLWTSTGGTVLGICWFVTCYAMAALGMLEMSGELSGFGAEEDGKERMKTKDTNMNTNKLNPPSTEAAGSAIPRQSKPYVA